MIGKAGFMHSVINVILLAFVIDTEASSKSQFLGNPDSTSMQTSVNLVADTTIDKFVNKLVDLSFRASTTNAMHHPRASSPIKTSVPKRLQFHTNPAVSFLPQLKRKVVPGRSRFRDTSVWAQDERSSDDKIDNDNELKTLYDLDAILGTEAPATQRPVTIAPITAVTPSPALQETTKEPLQVGYEADAAYPAYSPSPLWDPQNLSPSIFLRRWAYGICQCLWIILIARSVIASFASPDTWIAHAGDLTMFESFVLITQGYFDIFSFAGDYAFVAGYFVLFMSEVLLESWELVVKKK
eukprot:gnl/MRDRNA2_/MRDRNA2_115154_c0_seq1.p1 gnl/MRDRNA2_/MRDRNA2_115154_c0~~gnl/MRDRNA2_/MRDRNA2_115154_c0_seq1.p1  ORF type:complete len:297 (+),score=35.54 gnl/MRDRNA2_/MRDRNA2_115154_c0_seq1:48-938(+)